METIAPGKPCRVWPAALVAVVFWALQIWLSLVDVALFTRFMTNALGSLAFLLLFLILWFTNGTLPGRTRLAGFGIFVASLAAGIGLSHRSFDPISFMLTAVPPVLTAWVLWMVLARSLSTRTALVTLAIGLPLNMFFFDLFRWEGLDGRLKSSLSLRFKASEEDAYLASKRETAAAPSKAWTLRAGDWPEYRGSARDGVVRGLRIETNWKDVQPALVWKQRVGPGWSSVIVVDGFLVTQEQRGDLEAVVCAEASTGRQVWSHEDPARFSEGIAGAGPRATPTYRDGRVYSLGGGGLLTCLEAPTGKLVWSRDLGKENAAPAPQWGYSASPLVADGKVVVFAGGTGARGIVALDAATGAPVWTRLAGQESYCSAQLLTVRGKTQMLMQDNKILAGLSLSDGAILWERPNPEAQIIPMLQSSVLEDGKVVVASGAGLALLELREEGGKWSASERWSTPKFRPSFSNFVVHDGHVYGFDDGILACLDAKEGKRIWKSGRYGNGQLLLLADQGLLVLISEKGELALVPAKPQDPGEVARFAAIEGKTWNHPTIAQDLLIVRNAAEMACYRLRPLKSP